MKNELKPCPFCGGKAVFKTAEIKTGIEMIHLIFKIKCQKCESSQTREFHNIFQLDKSGEVKILRDDRKEAVAAWNQRAGDTP